MTKIGKTVCAIFCIILFFAFVTIGIRWSEKRDNKLLAAYQQAGAVRCFDCTAVYSKDGKLLLDDGVNVWSADTDIAEGTACTVYISDNNTPSFPYDDIIQCVMPQRIY